MATAIALFGPGSGAVLATVVGVLVVILRTRHWFPQDAKREI